MKLINSRYPLLIYALIAMQACFLTSCNTQSNNSKNQFGKTGFLGFNLDMDYSNVKSIMDSLLKIGELYYFETSDLLGNKQKNLYCDFSEISPAFYAKVNLRGSNIIDERLTSIQLTMCSRANTGNGRISYSCGLNELNRLFELYGEKYGTPTLLEQGEKYDWLAKRISNVYFPGPKGRWVTDRIYFWERGNYIIYFDFGYPESHASLVNSIAEPDVQVLPDSASAPIIYYDFTPEYLDILLEKAGGMKEEELK
jgi:hypothetical protein